MDRLPSLSVQWPEPAVAAVPWANATCLILNTASFVLCAVYSVKDRHTFPNCSPLSKKTCVRHVALDKWFPLSAARAAAA